MQAGSSFLQCQWHRYRTKWGLLIKILALFLCEGAGHRKEDHTLMRKTPSTAKHLEVRIKEKVMDQSLSFHN